MKKKLSLLLMIVLLSFIACACSDSESSTSDSEALTEGETLVAENLTKKGQAEFKKACKDIHLNVDEIDNFEKMDDWSSGERYSFGYKTASIKLYMLADDTVDSINIYGIKVYERGFEPYDIRKYIIDSETAQNLQEWSTEDVKEKLNRPETADFSWLDWGYCRNGDYYNVKSSVEAANFFNAKDKVSFMAQYKIDGEDHKLTYLSLDGHVYYDKGRLKDKERKPIKEKEQTKKNSASKTSSEIVLTDGEKGKYGKAAEVDGEKYYHYYIPTGKYKVKCKLPCTIFVVGEDSNDVKISKQLAAGDVASISVPNGYHIELSMRGKVIMKKK